MGVSSPHPETSRCTTERPRDYRPAVPIAASSDPFRDLAA